MNDTGDFTRWLKGHVEELNPLGSLARSIANDPQWPAAADIDTCRAYLESRGAAPELIDTLREAWAEFQFLRR
ncbi:YozE family protein [Streptomyces chiangmaiensis]|uniref:YozE family protein n=1 Tax=Streptomyces chiangmaiensis TaxID=766497 RepID=A0ABU7FFZ1_9ACTN|nr:YozE family protein [Streptomyces chiangmaiensis]MED7823050.1 YozE family protein [Streptomyces chiangmaiensis]